MATVMSELAFVDADLVDAPDFPKVLLTRIDRVRQVGLQLLIPFHTRHQNVAVVVACALRVLGQGAPDVLTRVILQVGRDSCACIYSERPPDVS